MGNVEVYQAVTHKIIAALEKGVVPWSKPWTGGGSNAPRNAITGRNYRGMNTWLLSLASQLRGFEDNRWATLTKFGRQEVRL